MSGLFKKLNTLVKATLNDALDLSTGQAGEYKPGPKLEREVKRLRERINEAIDHEDKLEARVNALKQDEVRLDAAANDAVQRGQQEAAREAIKQLAVVRKQREMTEADLRQHRHVAEELIRKVNMMEAAVADVNRDAAQSTDPSTEAPPTSARRVSIPVDGVEHPAETATQATDDDDTSNLPDAAQGALDRVNKAFTDAQSRITRMQDQLGAREANPTAQDQPADAPSEQEVDNELSRRVSRLSKRPPKPDEADNVDKTGKADE